MDNQVGFQRLTRLLEYLRNNVPDNRFRLETWVGSVGIPWQGDANISCGTTACAMGWATTIPEFRELGLKLVQAETKGYGQIVFDCYKSYGAVARFFGIPYSHADYLFCPDSYGCDENEKQEVVDRIQKYLDHGMIITS